MAAHSPEPAVTGTAPAGALLHGPHTLPSTGAATLIPYGEQPDGTPAVLQLSGNTPPHILITGTTGSGVTSTLRVIAIEAARQGIDVRACDPGRTGLAGLSGWPNITLASDVPQAAQLIADTRGDVRRRAAAVADGSVRSRDLRRILLLTSDLAVLSTTLTMAASDGPDAAGEPRHSPAVAQLDELARAGRASRVSLLVTVFPFHASLLDPRLLGEFGNRIALGRQSAAALNAMFGAAGRGCQVPPGAAGTGLALTAAGVTGVRAGWLPDPARWSEHGALTGEERRLLLDMLPPGATWPRHHRQPPPAAAGVTGDPPSGHTDPGYPPEVPRHG